jgi:hypothetical protein
MKYQTNIHDPNISRMSQSLIDAFVLTPDSYQLLLKIYNVSSIQHLVEQWIIDCLLHPDDELAKILLPQLITRFNKHLEQMKKKQWLS